MKCNNCRKNVTDNSNYCEFCGESFLEIEQDINLDMSHINEKNTDQINEAKQIIKKNKLIIGIVAAIIVVVIGGIFTLGYIKSQPLSDSEIKESLIGESVSIGNKTIKLSDENIEKIKVKNRSTEKKKSDHVNLELVVNYKKTKITLDQDISYYYNEDKKEWVKNYSTTNSVKNIETKNKFEDEISKGIKKLDTISNNYDYYTTVYGYQVSKISNYSFESEGIDREFTADIELSNGVYTTTGEIEGTAYYDFSSMSWKLDYVSIEKINDSKENKEIDSDLLNKIVKEYLGDSNVSYKYKVGEDEKITYFDINTDMISEIKVNNTTAKEDTNQLRLEIEGKASNGVVTNIDFSGVVMIPLRIGEDADTDTELEIKNVQVEVPGIEKIKELLLDENLGSDKIKLAEADTFKETEKYDKYVGYYYVNGTIEINGEVKEVQVKFALKKPYKKDYSWELSGIYEKSSFSYIEFK